LYTLIQTITLLTAILCTVYAIVLLAYAWAWRSMCRQQTGEERGFKFIPSVSVVIAARNERQNIGACLQSVLALEPLEVVVIDDHSTDGTAEFVEAQFPKVKLIRLADHVQQGDFVVSYKKKALETGIDQAKGDWIFCTDADCRMQNAEFQMQHAECGMRNLGGPMNALFRIPHSEFRIRNSAFRIRNSAFVCLCGPVLIERPRGFLQHFEALDVLNLAGVSGAGMALGWHHLGNGAFLMFEKKAFEAVGGYASHAGRASGDDVFLIQELAARYPGGVAWVHHPEAVVYTGGAGSWRSYFNQRLRWGSKNAALPEWRLKAVLLLVVLVNVLLCVPLGWVWGLFWLVKIGVDYLWLRRLGRFYGVSLRWFLPAALSYPFVLTFSVLLGLVYKNVLWKGRVAR